MSIDWRVPPSILHHLSRVPSDGPVALLLRHSVRDELPPDDVGYGLPITDVGQELAIELGSILGDRLKTLHTSPLARCVQTAEGLRSGAGVEVQIRPDDLLGDPGVFVLDCEKAWRHWQTVGHEAVMEGLVSQDDPMPGMARPTEAARFLVHHMLGAANGVPGIHVFVTHDSLVTATAARFLGRRFGTPEWPWFLEGALFWRDEQGFSGVYRDFEATGVAGPLCTLSEVHVVEFARREVARTVGLDSGARFFLAGGAFKTLLTGRPPRDLDLWATSPADRERLIGSLLERGAEAREAGPFADVFTINGRTVEVPHRVEPAELEERLGRFDIALSAVGVEHTSEGSWRAVIDPFATASVRTGQVLLLKPLVNWKYALATLERAKRYADELDFVVPPDDEDEVWRVFVNQPREMQEGMIERYIRMGRGTDGIREKAAELARR